MPNSVSFYGAPRSAALGENPGSYLMPRSRMALALMDNQPNVNNGSVTGGLATMLQQGMKGFWLGQAMREQEQQGQQDSSDMAKMLAGGQAKQWNNPDADYKPMIDNGQGQMVPTQAAGGYDGMIAALSGTNNPRLMAYAPNLMMGKMAQDEARRVEQAKLTVPREMAPGTVLYDPVTKQPIYQAPTTEKPLSNLGQLSDDLKNGRITQQDYNAAVHKLTTVEGETKTGPFAGNSLDAQAMNILLSGEPTSPAYQAAYAHLSAPRITIDPTTQAQTVIQPNLSWARPPGGPSQEPAAATPTPAAPAAPPPAAQPVPAPSPLTMPPNAPAVPSGPVAAGQPQSRTVGGVTVTTTPASGMSPVDRTKLNAGIEGAATLVNSLNDYMDAFKNAGTGERAKSVAGLNTPLNTSFNNAALLAKGDQLYQLGVLNGPDLDLIRRTLADPSTVTGAATSPDSVKQSVGKIINLLQDRISAQQMQFGLPVTNIVEHAAKVRAATQGAPVINNNAGGSLVPQADGSFNWVPNG